MSKKRITKLLLALILLITISFHKTAQLVRAEAEIRLIPGGENIAVDIKTNGLLITGTYDFMTSNGLYNPTKNADIKSADTIVKVDDYRITSVKDFLSVINKITAPESDVKLSLLRNDKTIDRKLKVVKLPNQSSYKTGLFVKERMLGTGTTTFYNPNNKSYGCLGHQMGNPNVLQNNGSIYKTSVVNIKKSYNGEPGEKISQIYENNDLGTITRNNNFGVYGRYSGTLPEKPTLPIMPRNQVKSGKAEIWTVINGEDVQKFNIEITAVKSQSKPDAKGLSFKVIDSALISLTGGIVQGMSGSPIIQNNKIVGAVTHVVIDNVQTGYGMFIEWMLAEANKS